MASPEPSAAADRRVAPAFTASSAGSMPPDAVYEILLRVPARDLCRFRAVSRAWRSLLSDPHFVAAHGARQPPLVVAGYRAADRYGGFLCDLVDLSGRVAKRVRATWDEREWVAFAQRDLICTARGRGVSFRLLDPARGAVHALPEGLAEEHTSQGMDICGYRAGIAFGMVPAIGQCKVLRVLYSGEYHFYEPLCEVLTLDGSIHSRWRGKEAPPENLDLQSRVVVGGIVYFFSNEALPDQNEVLPEQDPVPKCIASFDLETEEWRETLQGPMISLFGDADGMRNNHMDYDSFSMVDLNGSLALVHCISSFSMDLWFLKDFKTSLWVKQYSIQVNLSVQRDEFNVHPLLVLDDGRIVTYIGTRGLLRIYNPETSTYTDVAEMGPRLGIGLNTGNLLILPNCAS